MFSAALEILNVSAGIAEPPSLHDALAGDKLDLTALDPAAEEAECLTHAVAELRRHAGGGGELLAVGQYLVDGPGGGGDDGFLVNEHGCPFVWQAGCQLCLRDERRCRRRTHQAMKLAAQSAPFAAS